jgi:hypothetical protein
MWEKISDGVNLLCPRCIGDAIEDLGEYGAYELERGYRARPYLKTTRCDGGF